MKQIITTLFLALIFIGCNSDEQSNQNLEPKLVVQKNLSALTLNDQHEKPHTLPAQTRHIVFAFSKEVGHTCNDFFSSKEPGYLQQHHTLFVADVSAAPSLIRSMFIMPGLKEFKHTVLVLDDKQKAAEFKMGVDTDKIILVSLQEGIVSAVTPISTTQELEAAIQKI